MGGHVDDAELTYAHPVVSLSMGRPCSFLVGGDDVLPTPLPNPVPLLVTVCLSVSWGC